jgi:hypothetical protein
MAMRMKQNVCVLFLFLGALAYPADLAIINVRSIPSVEKYADEMAHVQTHVGYIASYIPDEYWNYPVSKAELSEHLIAFYNLLDGDVDHPDNQDLYLLKGIICTFLFNLDVQAYYTLAIDNFMHIDSLGGRDYRYKWMLGNLYICSIHPFEAIDQFKYVESKIPENLLHPLFWLDYAHAAALALMPANAVKYFELYAKYANASLGGVGLYQAIMKNFIYPQIDAPIAKNSLYVAHDRQDGAGVLSRPFGIWLSVNDQWSYKSTDYADRQSIILFTPLPIRHETAGPITYTIGAFFDLSGMDPRTKWLSKLPNCREVVDLDLNKPFVVYEYNDSKTYPNLGGSHGYIAFLKSTCPSSPGVQIEAAAELHTSDSDPGVSYVVLDKVYSRFQEPINYVFLLDTCNYIFEESKDVFVSFLNNLIVE